MTKIRENGMEPIEGYDELQNGEKFVYETTSYTYEAIKIDEYYAALINREGNYILAKKYVNVLSVGSGEIIEYRTYEELEKKVKNERIRASKHAKQIAEKVKSNGGDWNREELERLCLIADMHDLWNAAMRDSTPEKPLYEDVARKAAKKLGIEL